MRGAESKHLSKQKRDDLLARNNNGRAKIRSSDKTPQETTPKQDISMSLVLLPSKEQADGLVDLSSASNDDHDAQDPQGQNDQLSGPIRSESSIQSAIACQIDYSSDDTGVDNSDEEYDMDSSALVLSSLSTGSIEVIWEWALPKKRVTAPQPFFVIAQMISRNLNQKELKDGFIYAFKASDPQAKGCVKIGVSKTITRRMKDHKNCYGECVQIYPPKGQKLELVQHAHRVEALIHAELQSFSVSLRKCPRFRMIHKQRHGEWFEMSSEHVIAVIEKWILWSRSSQYVREYNPLYFSKSKAKKKEKEHIWKLKHSSQREIVKICTPFDTIIGE